VKPTIAPVGWVKPTIAPVGWVKLPL
jgi:hypothetical protein